MRSTVRRLDCTTFSRYTETLLNHRVAGVCVTNGLRRKAILVVAVLATLCPAWGLDPRQAVNSYLRTVFTTDDGLPTNVVNGIAEAGGFLWIATGSYLTRFDGRHFFQIPFNPNTFAVRALAATPDGALWLAIGHGLERVDRSYLSQTGPLVATRYIPDIAVTTLYVAHNGVLWAGSTTGLFRLDGNKFSLVVPTAGLSRIEEMPNGHIFLVTQLGVIEWDGAQAKSHADIVKKFGGPLGQIYHVHQDRSGALWVGSDRGLAREREGKVEWFLLPGKQGKSQAAYRVFEEGNGNIWASFESGMHKIDGNTLEPLSPVTGGRVIFEAHDGTLWFGTNGSGLVRLKDRLIRMFTRADGLPNETVMSVLVAHDGTLWVGNNCGGLSRFDGKNFQIYDETKGLSNSCVYSLAEAPNGDLWIATFRGGVFQFHDGRFTQYSTKNGLASDIVPCVYAARDGAIWMTAGVGVSCIRNYRIRNYTASDGLSDTSVLNIFQDRSGTIWLGAYRGVYRLVGDRFVSESGLKSGVALNVLGEDTSGNLILSGDDGIVLSPPPNRFRTYDVLQGAMFAVHGDWWSFGDFGILRVDADRMQKWNPNLDAPLDYASFGRSDGLSQTGRPNGTPTLAMTPDQRLWVATTAGLAMIDLANVPAKAAKPVTYVGAISVDGHKNSPGRELVLPPGPHRVELDFDSVELTSPEDTRLQYRLDGGDRKWLDAGPIHTATYSTVPLGRHQFHVRATNTDGEWDRQGIVYWVDQKPYYYQTTAFRCAVAGVILVFIGALYQYRLRQAAETLNARHEAALAERVRIARDLHDTTLQGIQGLVMLFDAGIQKLPKAEPARGYFEKVLTDAAQVLAEGRDRLQSLRSPTLERKDLSHELALAGEQMVLGADIDLRVTTRGVRRELQPEVADEVFSVGREALLNACTHSGARNVEIEIAYSLRAFQLRCRDHGRGIEPSILEAGNRPGHWGLPGMRERVNMIGGKIEIASQPGTGTEIVLTIPASKAYHKTSMRFWQQWHRQRSDE